MRCFIVLSWHDRLSQELKGVFESLNAQIKEDKLESPCRSFTEFEYSTLASWSVGLLIHYAIVPANYAKPVELTANGQLLTANS
jgi:hypothetical protein